MTVLIVGAGRDEHARAVEAAVTERGMPATIFDTHAFPGELSISLGADPASIEIAGERVSPSAVYIRDLGLDPVGIADQMSADWRRAQAAMRERGELVLSIVHRWEALGIPIYNPLSAFPRITKPFQLALLARAGLPVPDTLWTNDPAAVVRFAEGRRVAYKPVAGGAFTRILEPRDLDRLGALKNAPVCFQELLPGTDVRVFVVDGRVAAACEIEAGATDFREDERGITSVPPNPELDRICVRACEVLGLRFTGMDLKADASGKLKILELNPSPMFLGFDRKSGSNVLGALATALSRPAAA